MKATVLRDHLAVSLLGAVLASFAATAQAASLPIVRQFPSPGDTSDGLTVVNGNLWVWDVAEPDTFYVLDILDGSVLASYLSPTPNGATGLAFDGEFVWGVSGGVLGGSFAKFDPTDGALIGEYPLPIPDPTGITFDGTHLWISQIDNHQLVQIDPSTLTIVRNLTKEPLLSLDLAFDGQSLWLAAFERGEQSPRSFLYQIDPINGTTIKVFDAPGDGAVGLAFHEGLLFVSDTRTRTIYALAVPEPTAVCWALLLVALASVRRARHVFDV